MKTAQPEPLLLLSHTTRFSHAKVLCSTKVLACKAMTNLETETCSSASEYDKFKKWLWFGMPLVPIVKLKML